MIYKFFLLALQATTSILSAVRAKCIHNPAFECSRSVQGIQECQQTYACELECSADLEYCDGDPNDDNDCYTNQTASCEELSSRQELCEQYPDCTWAGSNQIMGPFLCGVSSVFHYSIGTIASSTSQSLERLNTTVCGVTPESDRGEWFAVVHNGYPIRVTTKESTVDNTFSVMKADSDLSLTCVAPNVDSSILLEGSLGDKFYIFVVHKSEDLSFAESDLDLDTETELDSALACDRHCTYNTQTARQAGFNTTCSCDPMSSNRHVATTNYECEICDTNGTHCALQTTGTAVFNSTGGWTQFKHCAKMTKGSNNEETFCFDRKQFDQVVYSFQINNQDCTTITGDATGNECSVAFDCSTAEDGLIFDLCPETDLQGDSSFYSRYFLSNAFDYLVQGRCDVHVNPTASESPSVSPTSDLEGIPATEFPTVLSSSSFCVQHFRYISGIIVVFWTLLSISMC